MEIPNIVLQGTVFGNLECTATMDKVGKFAYESKKPIYKYKGVVDIPPLGMVHDLLVISKCGNDSAISNSMINSFIECKKLKLNVKKCSKIHIGKIGHSCPDLNPIICGVKICYLSAGGGAPQGPPFVFNEGVL